MNPRGTVAAVPFAGKKDRDPAGLVTADTGPRWVVEHVE